MVPGLLVGIGLAAFVDETVFHQLLGWHHFYDRGSTRAGLVSDGVFHAFGWFATVAGLVGLIRLVRAHRWLAPPWAGGLLLGTGLFQLYDGTVQHKLLRLHQIRYQVDLLPYDLTWNVVAVVLVVAGLLTVLITRRRRDQPATR